MFISLTVPEDRPVFVNTALNKKITSSILPLWMGINPKDSCLTPKPKSTASTSPKLNKAGHYRPALFMFKNTLSTVII